MRSGAIEMSVKAIKGSCNDFGCWVGDLLEGCRLCMEGLKTVVFVTGVCPERCYYCPLSRLRKGLNIIYVNEVRAEDISDIIAESIISGSRGAGITGGDPIARLERTINIIRGLKEFFGNNYHIHLYTSGILLSRDGLRALIKAGLDELRIHITGEHSWRALKIASGEEIATAIENPVIPNSGDFLKSLVRKALNLGVRFINLNELEFSESNYEALIMRGFRPSSRDGVAAEGSMETAIKLMNWVIREGFEISVHFCPAIYKDRYQFRRRMLRRGLRTRQFYEEIDDGLARWAEVSQCLNPGLKELILSGLAVLRDGKVIINPSMARKLRCKGFVVEAYPTNPRRELNRYPIES